MSNTFGNYFKVTTFGESHGTALGCVVDGCPAGLPLTLCDFATDMARRRPGSHPLTSPRCEADAVQILSGVFENMTTGTPISLLIHNTDHKPVDYEALRHIHRDGHADYTYQAKYGIRDHRGGGRASGRETVARVAAGVIAKKILAPLNITIETTPNIHPDTAQIAAEGDSTGSSVTCRIANLKAGIGQPVFNKLSSSLMSAASSMGGVRAVEIGQGVDASSMRGSHHNPIDKGILGGISDGNPIALTVHFKPPSSIAIGGRHDPVLALRAAVVVEAMVAITLVDHIFASFSDTMDGVIKNY